MKKIIANFCETIYSDIVLAQKELQHGNIENTNDWLNTAKKNMIFVKEQIEKL